MDKALRVAIGIVLLSLLIPVGGTAHWWGLIGVVPLLPALFGYCPLYSPFGFDTTNRR